uniref:Neuropeptide Y prohormone 1 n=1 Tax=Schmidtea mediterranea TaxID=79327 RepID=E3T7T7_SCHMD|nr:neuropeptide Y prohormone 1 [Schmidtea mediterranea]
MTFIYGFLCLTLVNVICSQKSLFIEPPAKPEFFDDPELLRNYIKKLNEYFAIVGRPRFGKRFDRGFS